MDKPMILKPLPAQCDCQQFTVYDANYNVNGVVLAESGCPKCFHMRCEYCNDIGTRKAQTFEALFKDEGDKTIIYYECDKPECERHRSHDFDMGKAMAKGEL